MKKLSFTKDMKMKMKMGSLHIMKYYCVQKQFRKDSTDQQEENEEVPPKDRAKFTPHLQESQGREIKWNIHKT